MYIVIYEYYCCKIMNPLEIKEFAENDVGSQLQALWTCMVPCVDLFKFWTFCTKDNTPTWMWLPMNPQKWYIDALYQIQITHTSTGSSATTK